MAAQKKYRYGQGAVNGSLAYDYDKPALEPEYEYGRPLDIPARPRVKEEVVAGTQVLTRQGVSPFALLGFAIAAVLIVMTLIARVQFTQASAEAATLQSQLDQLTEQQSKLTIAYESALNLTDIENYAINTLGMQKPQADQIRYINSSAQDKAEVLDGTAAAAADDSGDMLKSIKEYLG